MLGFDLPNVLRQDPDLIQLVDYANAIISIQNDMFSLKKELEHDLLNNICILLYVQHGDLQLAIDDANTRVSGWITKLDRTGRVLLARYDMEKDPRVAACVVKYVEGCEMMCTGNVTWSYENGRYGLTVDD
jgi:hypothetical protein